MTDYRSRIAFRFLNWTIGLILVWLSIETLFLFVSAESHSLFRYLHLFLVFSLVILALIGNLVWKSQKAAHIRELEEMQREVEKSALRYKNLLEGAGDAIFVINGETGRLEEVNVMGTEMLGYSREELGELAGKDLIDKSDHTRFVSLVKRVNRTGLVSSESLTFRRKDGFHLVGEVNARLIDLGDARVVQAIIRDTTQKKNAEQEIRKRNRKLSILNSIIARANASLDLHTVLDVTLQETLEVFDAEGGTIHLLEDGQILTLVAKKNLTDTLVAATRKKDTALDTSCRVIATRQCYAISGFSSSGCSMAWHSREDGWKTIIGIPLFAKNSLIGVMHLMSSVEKRYLPEDANFFTTMGNQIGIVIEHARLFAELNWKTAELLRSHRLLEKNSCQLTLSENRLRKNLALVEHANLELARLDRMKSHFLGMVSHEFKTPLTAILCSTDFLLSEGGNAVNDDARRLLGIIRKGGTRLNEIISDLLKVARLEAKAAPVCMTILHFGELLGGVIEQFSPILRERNMRVSCEGADAIPYFSGDRECLNDVFTRLLENAVKFTPDGGEVVIAASVTGREYLEARKETLVRFNPTFYDKMANAGYLQVEMRDSGVGIAPDERCKIFDTFYEIGDIRHHTTGKDKFQGKGAGLGLAIVKGMIEAHGGMVWVESPQPESSDRPGSSFFLLIPLEEGISQTVFPFMQQEQAGAAPGFPSRMPGVIDERP